MLSNKKCHNNIRLMHIVDNDDVNHWYRYMTTCTIFNSWDTAAHALNGMDKDGDLVLLTDNKVLVENYRPLPAIMCAQRKATKVNVTEEHLIQSNIDSFGDDIGKITNRITTMFDVQSQYEPGSKEYQVLDYRIRSGQLYQQNAIDKAKGIIAKPMPKEWYDRLENRISDEDTIEDIERKEFNLRILADKKPYFMRYIYPDLMKRYNTYIKNSDKKCLREFRQNIEEIQDKEANERSEAENEFLNYYYQRMPVGMHKCVMNKICKRFEDKFDNYFFKNVDENNFNYEIMKSGQDYTITQYNAIAKLYDQYSKNVQEFMQFGKQERIDKDESAAERHNMICNFKIECEKISSNSSQLCDIILDLCYNRSGTKQFCWDMCGDEIINNLLEKNNYTIHFPVQDNNGDVEFCKKRFSIKSKEICE